MKRLLPLLLLLGCAAPKPGRPPEIAFGRQECARCGMIISEERFASGYVEDDGASTGYDDLGELLAALEEHPELKPRSWVRDMKGGGWLHLEAARVVHVPGLATPMGTGWVAFAKPEEADTFVHARARR